MASKEELCATASMEGTFLTASMDAQEQRDVTSTDTPNAFSQAKLNRKEGQTRVTMKITGVLVKLLTKKAPHTHTQRFCGVGTWKEGDMP